MEADQVLLDLALEHGMAGPGMALWAEGEGHGDLVAQCTPLWVHWPDLSSDLSRPLPLMTFSESGRAPPYSRCGRHFVSLTCTTSLRPWGYGDVWCSESS